MEARYQLMEKRDTAVLGYGHADIVDGEDKIVESTADYTRFVGKLPDGNAREMLLKVLSPISSTIFYRRSAA